MSDEECDPVVVTAIIYNSSASPLPRRFQIISESLRTSCTALYNTLSSGATPAGLSQLSLTNGMAYVYDASTFLPESVVLVFDTNPLGELSLVYHFLRRTLSEAALNDLLEPSDPFYMGGTSASGPPIPTPSLWALPLYPLGSPQVKSFVIVFGLDVEDVARFCKITHVHYRDWAILLDVYEELRSTGAVLIRGGEINGQNFIVYGHNMLQDNVMVSVDHLGQLTDVFIIDDYLFSSIHQL